MSVRSSALIREDERAALAALQAKQQGAVQKLVLVDQAIQKIATTISQPAISGETFQKTKAELQQVKQTAQTLGLLRDRQRTLAVISQLETALEAKNPTAWRTEWLVRGVLVLPVIYYYGTGAGIAGSVAAYAIQKGSNWARGKMSQYAASLLVAAPDQAAPKKKVHPQ